jgi:hypothetical protein
MVVFECARRIDAGAIGEIEPSTQALTAAAFRASGTTQTISRRTFETNPRQPAACGTHRRA